MLRRSASQRFVPRRSAPRRFAPRRSAPRRFTSLRFTSERFVLRRSASQRFVPRRFTSLRFAPRRFTSLRSAPLKVCAAKVYFAEGLRREGLLREGLRREGLLREGLRREGLLREGLRRSGIRRSGVLYWLIIRHLFQASTPSLSLAKLAVFTICSPFVNNHECEIYIEITTLSIGVNYPLKLTTDICNSWKLCYRLPDPGITVTQAVRSGRLSFPLPPQKKSIYRASNQRVDIHKPYRDVVVKKVRVDQQKSHQKKNHPFVGR